MIFSAVTVRLALAAALAPENGVAREVDSPMEPEPVVATGDDPPAEVEEVPAEPEVQDREPAQAPNRARLRGRVLIYGDQDPAAGARLIPKDGSAPVESDENGRFAVFLLPGTYTFIVRAPGFDDLEVEVTLAAFQDLEMEYFLAPSLTGGRYRTVVEHRREAAVSSTTLSGREIREIPGTAGDPLRVINSLPGVSQLAGFLPYVVVRGAAPGNTGYYLDGTRVPILFHVAVGPSVIHPYFIDAVDFYPSGAPVRLGKYASGIIEARTRPARRDRVHGEVDLRLVDVGALLEIPISRPVIGACEGKPRRKCRRGNPRGAVAVAGRYSYTGLLLSTIRSDVKIRYWDYQARFDHDLGPRARYTAFAYGSYDELGAGQTEANLESTETTVETLLRFSFHRFDNRITSRLPGGGRGTYALVLGVDQTGLTELKTDEYRVAPRLDFEVPTRNKSISLGFGLDQELQLFRLDNQLEDDEFDQENLALLFGDRFVSATGAYFDVVFQKGPVQVRPGLRADLYAQVGASPYLPDASSTTSAFGVDPRLLLREELSPRWTLKQALGMYHQPPSFPIPIPGIESFGFERGLQRNTQGAFGYEFEVLQDKIELHQEAYVGYFSNLQDYELAEAVEDDPINELEDVITQVSGWSYGLETMLKLKPDLRVFGWAAYTLSRSTRNFPVGGHAPATWDQRHILNLVLGYRISHKWTIGGRVHYHTGRPWTARDETQSQSQAESTNRNNARLPAFFQLDLRAERTWTWNKWQLAAVLDVANAAYSYETYQCSGDGDSVDGSPSILRAAGPTQISQVVDPARGIVQCTPTGFRYIIPSLGVRARW